MQSSCGGGRDDQDRATGTGRGEQGQGPSLHERIIFAKSYTKAEGTEDEETRFVAKAHNVFNAQQVGGVELEPEDPPLP